MDILPLELSGRQSVPVEHTSRGKRFVTINDSGMQRIGEDHASAKPTNAQVDETRDRYEAGVGSTGPKVGYRVLAKEYDVSKRTIRDIVSYRSRNQWPGRWKRLR